MGKVKKVWVTLLVCILFPFNTSYAFQNEPVNGFKDLYWGETLQEIQEQYSTKYLGYIPARNAVVYGIFNKNTENAKDFSIGNIALGPSGLVLYLWDNQLYRIDICTTNIAGPVDFDQQYNDLSEMMKIHFGEPTLEYADRIGWADDSFVILFYKRNNKYGIHIGNVLILTNRNLDNLASQDAASSGW